MPEKYTGGGGGRIYWGITQYTFFWPKLGVWAIIGLTEQLDQQQLEIILSLAHDFELMERVPYKFLYYYYYDLRALPLCDFYEVTQWLLLYII